MNRSIDDVNIDTSTLYVPFLGAITYSAITGLFTAIHDADKSTLESIYLCLSTPGGSVAAAKSARAMLAALPYSIITHNIGSVDSMGNLIFLAGNPRYAIPDASFMIHEPRQRFSVGRFYRESEIRQGLNQLVEERTSQANAISSSTGLDAEKISSMLRGEHRFNAAWAKEHGFIDEIREVPLHIKFVTQLPPQGGQDSV